ncbi:NHL repeat protein [Leptospira terpstrae serovar Hualin str. LT 11-33 = ATCC 700639]|uniref:NHL repeat protein n=2 Tax=Leptospira TaxID=171 RepID=N1VZ97_9LEPT|nr:NHL repeat protein [Leptospira terpstrae serovar Hualin str. LT 11-33 = ATCC 700639]
MTSRFLSFLISFLWICISCGKPKISNPCDPNSQSFFNNLLLKVSVGDISPYCKMDTSFSLNGTIVGLSTSGMILRTNTGTEISIAAGSTSFSIPVSLGLGARYTLSIASQPSSIVCIVHSGWEGVIPAGITGIQIICHTTTANRVYGQLNFNSNINGIGPDLLNSPSNVIADGKGIYLSDFGNNRILYYSGLNTSATGVIGQTDLISNISGVSTTEINQPRGLAKDLYELYVADSGNYRALYFEGLYSAASRVYGQPDFISSGLTAPASDSLGGPYAIARGSAGFYIVDNGNNRVLYYPGTSTTATRVYGQPDFVSSNPNNGFIGAGTLNSPKAVFAFGGDLWIADTFNNRVLLFSGINTIASKVFGQNGSFTSSTNNTTASTFFQPQGISIDQNGIYIVDTVNNRVLVF